MIRFYPRNIGMWRSQFDFSERITLEHREKKSWRDFANKSDFIEFLKSNGVRLDDINHPLKFNENNRDYINGLCYDVIQWTVIVTFRLPETVRMI